MKKTLAIILAALMLVTFMAGCNKTTQNTGEKVDLLMGLPDGDALTPRVLVDNFIAAHPEYNVTVDEASWSDLTKKLKLQFTAKQDVTSVFFTDSDTAFSFNALGALEDLKDRVDKDLDKDLYTAALYGATDTEGRLIGVPHAINPIALAYNKVIFDKYNVPYPTEDWTYEDMYAAAEKLTVDENNDGETDIYGLYVWNGATAGWGAYFRATGAEPFGENLDRSNLKDPKVKEAFEHYKKPFDEGWAPDNAFIATYGNFPMAFMDGKIAMGFFQASSLPLINEGISEKFDYDVQYLPIGWNGERTSIYVPNVWSIYSGASEEVKDAAWEWIKHYMSEESQMTVAIDCLGGYPIMKTALDSIANNGKLPENKHVFYDQIDVNGKTIFESPVSSSVGSLLRALTTKISTNEGTIDELLDEYDKLVQEEFDFYFESKQQ